MHEQIKILRQEIDSLDTEIIRLISERFGVSQKIIDIKKSLGEEAYDKNREEEIISRLIKITNLPSDSVKKIYISILNEAKVDN
jgi:chorismate mutase